MKNRILTIVTSALFVIIVGGCVLAFGFQLGRRYQLRLDREEVAKVQLHMPEAHFPSDRTNDRTYIPLGSPEGQRLLQALPPTTMPTQRQILDAIWVKESNAMLYPKDGDGGKAIGPYQIWHDYWADAVEFDPSIGGTYQDCRDKDYAEKVVLAYWRRYAPAALAAGDVYTLARKHNGGGPSGDRKLSTVAYGRAVVQILNDQRP